MRRLLSLGLLFAGLLASSCAPAVGAPTPPGPSTTLRTADATFNRDLAVQLTIELKTCRAATVQLTADVATSATPVATVPTPLVAATPSPADVPAARLTVPPDQRWCSGSRDARTTMFLAFSAPPTRRSGLTSPADHLRYSAGPPPARLAARSWGPQGSCHPPARQS